VVAKHGGIGYGANLGLDTCTFEELQKRGSRCRKDEKVEDIVALSRRFFLSLSI
jgi:hypothetical protein